ncbi:MAG: 50S ribosomal protein L1 [bacterium]|nr:50S ribosomal protein L1 [bacterium]
MSGKKYREVVEKIDRSTDYGLREASELVVTNAFAKFDESIDLAFRLGVDPRHADEMIRGSVVLPHGTGKIPKILALAKGEKQKEAEEAGADFVGLDDYIERIEKEDWFEFDAIVATPDVMKQVSRLGKQLGPRGLMPSPKTGSVTFELADAIEIIKKGKVDYKVDKAGNLHMTIGKVSFGPDKIYDNVFAVTREILKARPAAFKGTYIKKITLSSTMGPGVRIDKTEVALATV